LAVATSGTRSTGTPSPPKWPILC